MRLSAWGGLILALLVSASCTTTRVDGQARAEPSQRIEVLALVFDNTVKLVPQNPRGAYSSIGQEKAADTEHKLTTLIEQRFPPAFAAQGIELQVYWRSNAAYKMTPDPRRRHVLYLAPTSASYQAGAGTSRFYLRAQVDELRPQRTLWSGTISVMRHQFADLDEKSVDELAASIIEDLKTAGILGVAGNPLAAVAKPVTKPTRAVEDVDAVPLLDERGRQGYRDWLTKKPPRAFVIAEDGQWNSSWGSSGRTADEPKDPAERAMANCRKRALKNCRFYAIDDRVVWPAEQ